MTHPNEIQQGISLRALGTAALQGGILACALLNIFLLLRGISYETYVFTPMTTITIGGAGGGIFFYLADYYRRQNGWNRFLVYFICIAVYIAALFFGLLYGLSHVGLWD